MKRTLERRAGHCALTMKTRNVAHNSLFSAVAPDTFLSPGPVMILARAHFGVLKSQNDQILLKYLQLRGLRPLDSHEGLCPRTPLGAKPVPRPLTQALFAPCRRRRVSVIRSVDYGRCIISLQFDARLALALNKCRLSGIGTRKHVVHFLFVGRQGRSHVIVLRAPNPYFKYLKLHLVYTSMAADSVAGKNLSAAGMLFVYRHSQMIQRLHDS
jgi:hypothetical protein